MTDNRSDKAKSDCAHSRTYPSPSCLICRLSAFYCQYRRLFWYVPGTLILTLVISYFFRYIHRSRKRYLFSALPASFFHSSSSSFPSLISPSSLLPTGLSLSVLHFLTHPIITSTTLHKWVRDSGYFASISDGCTMIGGALMLMFKSEHSRFIPCIALPAFISCVFALHGRQS